jgi:uncharacterized protein (TIGR03083 family)
MPQLELERYDTAIGVWTATLADLADGDLAIPIPTCPDWTLRQLLTHVGRAQRWAAAIVSQRRTEFLPFREVPDGRFPDDQAERGQWLLAGAGRLIDSIGQAGGAQVWTNSGALAPASYWARRMAHEVLVHCADAQLAVGQPVHIPADLGADGIDEWLGLAGVFAGAAAAALPDGSSLHVHATDAEPAGSAEWLISRHGGSTEVTREHGRADVALTGPAGALLLVLVRRLPPDDPQVTVHGDADVLAAWLAATPF